MTVTAPHHLGVRPGSEQEAGRGVPQRVQVDAGQSGVHGEQLESPEHVARLERRPDLRGEHQAGVPPRL
jgi:hypothetical protein